MDIYLHIGRKKNRAIIDIQNLKWMIIVMKLSPVNYRDLLLS